MPPIRRQATRREFLKQAALATWLGSELSLDSLAAAQSVPSQTGGAILRLRLLATRLPEMETFYARTMGWETERSGGSLRVQAGGTQLRFDEASDDLAPYYHVAWAIPSNKFELGKAWLAARTPLLAAPDGRDEFHFRYAKRRAVYFADPSGNVLELVARDDLGDTASGAFGLADLLYVNHVGLVVEDMDAAIDQVRSRLDLQPTAPPQPTFTTLGDVHRHLVLVPKERIWIPEMTKAAEVFRTDVVLHGPKPAGLELPGHPYRLSIEA